MQIIYLTQNKNFFTNLRFFFEVMVMLYCSSTIALCQKFELKEKYLYDQKKTYINYADTYKNPLDVHKLILTDIGEVPDDINRLENLSYLKITSENKDEELTSLPNVLYYLKNLNYLIIENTNLKEINSNIGLLKQLKVLSLANNKIESLPEEISELQNLETLDLGGIPIPTGLEDLLNLKTLATNQLNLPIIPTLENLYFGGNQLIRRAENLTNLKSLYFENKEIVLHLALSVLSNLKGIQKLAFDANKLDRHAVNELQKMKSIKELEIRNPKMLPIELTDLDSLNTLRLYGLECLTENSCLEMFDVVQSINNLDTLYLDTYTPQINRIKQISKLCIEHNEGLIEFNFIELRKQLNGIEHLKTLSLFNSKLSKSKNVSFRDFDELFEINLAYTGLPYEVYIYQSLSQLQSLRVLHLSNQDLGLISCPRELGMLSQLRKLYIYNIQEENNQYLHDHCKQQIRQLLPDCEVEFFE